MEHSRGTCCQGRHGLTYGSQQPLHHHLYCWSEECLLRRSFSGHTTSVSSYEPFLLFLGVRVSACVQLVGLLVGSLGFISSGSKAESSTPFPSNEAGCDQRKTGQSRDECHMEGESQIIRRFRRQQDECLGFIVLVCSYQTTRKEGAALHDVCL